MSQARAWGGRRVQRLATLVVSVYGARCWRCSQPIDLTRSRKADPLGLMVGHVLARSRGGSDRIENLRPEHRECGLSAGNRLDAPARRRSARFFTPSEAPEGPPLSPLPESARKTAEYARNEEDANR